MAARDLGLLTDKTSRVDAAMTLTGTMTDTRAVNVRAYKPGRGRTLVISTPLTGWFGCGAERGPGVAVLLRTAAALMSVDRPALVIGTGSHEIGHLGMTHLLSSRAPDVDDVEFWFHFGASLAARNLDSADAVPSMKHLVGTAVSERLVRNALGALVRTYVDGSSTTPGESGQIISAGYRRFAGMVGTFPGFHTPADRGAAIDFELLESIAGASLTVLRRATMETLP